MVVAAYLLEFVTIGLFNSFLFQRLVVQFLFVHVLFLLILWESELTCVSNTLKQIQLPSNIPSRSANVIA